MGFLETLVEIGKKVPEIANSLKELSNDKGFQDHLGKAGTIGSLCLIGLDIYTKIKQDLQTDERRAFGSLLKIIFESTKKCLDKADEIELKELKTEDLINELFDIFVQTGYEWDFDLPSNPVIDRFKAQILQVVKANHYDDIDLRKFFVDFRIEIEYRAVVDDEIKAIADQNIKPLYIGTKLQKLSNDLKEYLENLVKSFKDEMSPLDNKRLIEHYLESKAVLGPAESWNKEDKDISVDSQWTIEDFLRGKDWRLVIGGTYGIGKTSFVKHLAADFASKHLEAPIGLYNYIPVFVSLKKGGLNNVYNENDLDYVLQNIIAPDIGKNRKILVIYDGLDEYEGNITDLISEFVIKHKQLRNLRQIITTRLEEGFEKRLGIQKYVRLVPFDRGQVDEFFSASKYNIPDVNYGTLEKYGLQDEKERVKPLFCWMFGVIYLKSGLKTYTQQPNIGKSLLYLNFIQSLFISSVSYGKWIFRKIAALKMIYGNELTETTVGKWLTKFAEQERQEGLSEFLVESQNEELLKPILTSYFRLQLGGKRPSPIIDFTHKTFKEYLLAEFYIESLLNHKPYRLNIGTPSKETIDFLDGLLELIKVGKNKPVEAQIIEDFVIDNESRLSEPREELVRYAQDLFHNEQVFVAIEEDYKEEKNELWITHYIIPQRRYHEFWIHRWLALYVSNKLRSDCPVNGKKLEILIENTGHTIPYYLKKLVKANLSGANLSGADLYGADLSGANLSGAELLNANLWNANLYGANLSEADLYNASLYTANLSEANLAKANLTNANLYGAKLFNTILSDANLYHINCDEAFVTNTLYKGQRVNARQDLRKLSTATVIPDEQEW